VRSLEISINGELKSVAGAANAESIDARVFIVPRLDESHLVVSGQVEITDAPNAEAAWLSIPLRLGDVVAVRLVEHFSPTAPKLGRYDPAGSSRDGIPVCCAFCGKSSDQIEGGMLASIRALICRPCVQFMHAIIVSEGGA
jgi:hypothetical protein